MGSTTMDRRFYFVIPQWHNVCDTMGTIGVQIRSDRIRSDFGTKICISDQIDKVVS
jgi:hypothetical protein